MSLAREKLLTTALELFLYEGFQSVGVDRVIKCSGISKMTLYKYFSSKDDLIEECLKRYHAEIIAEIQQRVAQSPLVMEPQIAGLLAWYRAKFIDTSVRGCLFVSAANLYSEPEHPIHQVCQLHKQTLIELFSRLLQMFGYANPQALALQCLILFEGARNLSAIGITGDSLDAATQVLTVLLQHHRVAVAASA